MIRVFWHLTPEDLYLLLSNDFNRLAFFRSDGGKDGTFTEVTDINTRLVIRSGVIRYEFVDTTAATLPTNTWYKTSYYTTDGLTQSPESEAFLAVDPRGRVGWSFNTYKPPEGLFGEILTADDMRYTYLWGIDELANDIENSSWEDTQYKYYVDSAVQDFEGFLDIDIYRRIRKTEKQIAENGLQKADFWMEGVDYTDVEPVYDFDPDSWQQFGFMQLRHRPIISVERVILRTPLNQDLLDLTRQNWVRIKDKEAGQINLFPDGGLQFTFSPFITGPFIYQHIQNGRYPQGMDVNYTSGFENAGEIPSSMRDVIGKYAAIKSLASIGDGLIAGVANTTLTLDGITEGFSSTQSATSAYFGARIHQYTQDIKEWMKHNRYRFGGFPLGFVGGR